MKKQKNPSKKLTNKEICENTVNQVEQLLHLKLPTQNLIELRDLIISKRSQNWDKNSYLGKALKFHFRLADLGKLGNINYQHLLLAELIRNFSIATKEEYLKKCEEFRIYPFLEKTISKKDLKQSNMTVGNIVDIMKKSSNEMEEKISKDIEDEVNNALNKDYPICSFEDLIGKSRLN